MSAGGDPEPGEPADAAPTPRGAWLVFGLGALCFTYAFFHRVAPSVMVDDLMRDFAVGGAILGNLSAVYFYVYAGLQLPVGMIIDRWGARRVLAAMISLAAVGGMLFASAESLGMAYIGRALVGGGVAFGFVGSLSLATHWFPTHRFAMLTGLVMFAGMSGAVLGQWGLSVPVELFGWRATMMAGAAFGFLLAVALWLFVRDRPPGAAAETVGAARTESVWAAFRGLGGVIRRPQTWWLALFGGMMSAPLLSFAGLWGVPYMMERFDLTRPVAAFSMTFMLVGWALGGPAAGWISDRLGRRRLPMMLGAAIALVTICMMLYLPDLPLAVFRGLMFLNGFAGGSMIICYAAVRENNPGQGSATAYGFVNMATVTGGAVFQPIVGLLLDHFHDGTMVAGVPAYSSENFLLSLGVLPAVYGTACVATLFVRETWCRPVVAPA